MENARSVRYRTLVADSARWDGFEFRPGDIVISTPPKCGTTWMQTICGLLVFGSATFPRPLDRISPWLDLLARPIEEVRAELGSQRHRRFIKTHTPLDGLPFDDRVTYILVSRDPRDVALSWDSHLANANGETFLALRESTVGAEDITDLVSGLLLEGDSDRDRFWSWMNPPDVPGTSVSGLDAMLHHIRTFWELRDQPNVILFRYEDLLDDLEGRMRSLAGRLGLGVPEELWPDLVRAATFDEMKARSRTLVPEASHEGFYKDPDQFFHKGRSGQWQQILSAEDVSRYEARVADLADASMAAWIHRRALPAAEPAPRPV